MNLLAIDTATEACSAALVAGEARHARWQEAPQEHTRLLLPMTEAVLDEAGLDWSRLDGLAYGRGPGSFTGLRIATGVIQGLSLSLNIPVVPVSVLASLAYRVFRQTDAEYACVATDARMSEVYWATYERGADGYPLPLSQERVDPPEGVAWRLEQGSWAAIGTGWSRYSETLAEQGGATNLLRAADDLPHASDMAEIAVAQWHKGAAVVPEHALPVYVRNQVASKKS